MPGVDLALGIPKAPLTPAAPAAPGHPAVEELRNLVATGDASAAATAKNFRDRYARLLKDFRNAKTQEQRVYVAGEIVAAQGSSEPLERFYAVHAMTRLAPAFFRDALTDAAKDSDSHVANLARQALDRLAEAS